MDTFENKEKVLSYSLRWTRWRKDWVVWVEYRFGRKNGWWETRYVEREEEVLEGRERVRERSPTPIQKAFELPGNRDAYTKNTREGSQLITHPIPDGTLNTTQHLCPRKLDLSPWDALRLVVSWDNHHFSEMSYLSYSLLWRCK